jgi:hypothetical protein
MQNAVPTTNGKGLRDKTAAALLAVMVALALASPAGAATAIVPNPTLVPASSLVDPAGDNPIIWQCLLAFAIVSGAGLLGGVVIYFCRYRERIMGFVHREREHKVKAHTETAEELANPELTAELRMRYAQSARFMSRAILNYDARARLARTIFLMIAASFTILVIVTAILTPLAKTTGDGWTLQDGKVATPVSTIGVVIAATGQRFITVVLGATLAVVTFILCTMIDTSITKRMTHRLGAGGTNFLFTASLVAIPYWQVDDKMLILPGILLGVSWIPLIWAWAHDWSFGRNVPDADIPVDEATGAKENVFVADFVHWNKNVARAGHFSAGTHHDNIGVQKDADTTALDVVRTQTAIDVVTRLHNTFTGLLMILRLVGPILIFILYVLCVDTTGVFSLKDGIVYITIVGCSWPVLVCLLTYLGYVAPNKSAGSESEDGIGLTQPTRADWFEKAIKEAVQAELIRRSVAK